MHTYRLNTIEEEIWTNPNTQTDGQGDSNIPPTSLLQGVGVKR